MITYKRLSIVLIVIILLYVGWFFFFRTDNPNIVQLENVTTSTVMVGDVQKKVFADGPASARSSRSVVTPMAGVITEISVSENQIVTEGQRLVVIDASAVGGGTQTVTAPIAGTVTLIDVSVDTIVAAQTFLLEIKDLTSMIITTTVTESDAVSVKKGQSATISFPALDDLEVGGLVDFIGISPTNTNATNPLYKVVVTLETIPDQLLNGMTANIDIVIDEKQEVLTLESVYLFNDDGKTYAKRIVSKNDNAGIGETEKVLVEKGFEGETSVEILTGLKEGDEVVLPTDEITAQRSNRSPFQ